jgi:hypothetical protein
LIRRAIDAVTMSIRNVSIRLESRARSVTVGLESAVRDVCTVEPASTLGEQALSRARVEAWMGATQEPYSLGVTLGSLDVLPDHAESSVLVRDDDAPSLSRSASFLRKVVRLHRLGVYLCHGDRFCVDATTGSSIASWMDACAGAREPVPPNASEDVRVRPPPPLASLWSPTVSDALLPNQPWPGVAADTPLLKLVCARGGRGAFVRAPPLCFPRASSVPPASAPARFTRGVRELVASAPHCRDPASWRAALIAAAWMDTQARPAPWLSGQIPWLLAPTDAVLRVD